MARRLPTILILCCLPFFMTGTASADWLDKLKETAKDLTDKAGEALENAVPTAPSTSDGEGQVKKPATTAAPAKPAAPEPKAVAAPAAPAQPAVSGNNDKTLVRETQKELKRLGYSIGVDGAYGPNTKKQIIAFEQSQSLEPTGDASVELLAKLKETPTPKATEPAVTAAAPTPEAAKPKGEPAPAALAADSKPKPVKDEPTAAGNSDIFEVIVEQADPESGNGAIFANFAMAGSGEIIRTSFYFQIYGGKKFTSIMPSRTLPQGNFKAYVTTETGSYEYEGRCKGICRSKPPKENASASYEDFVALTNTGGILEFRVETENDASPGYVGKTFKVRVPSLQERTAASQAEQEKADKIAAAEQAEKDKQAAAMAAEKEKQEKKAAYAGALSPESKMAFENCEGHLSSRNFYSCQCIAEQTPAFVEAEAARKLDSTNKLIAIVEDSIKKNEANTQLPEKQKEYKNNALQEKLRQAKQTKTLLEAPSSSRDEATRRNLLQTAELHLYKEPTCKVGDGMRENEYAQCLKSSSSKNIKGKTAEEYCRCSADTVAKLWTSSTQSYSSKVAVSLPVQARTQCRK